VPLTERLEEFLRNRDIQVDLNAIQQQLQDQILAGLSAGIGYSLSTIQIFNFVTLILQLLRFSYLGNVFEFYFLPTDEAALQL